MKAKKSFEPHVGDQLKSVVMFASFGGLFFSLMGTGLIWAGTDSFACQPSIWRISLALNFSLSALAWLVYLPFRNTDKLLANGLLALFFLFSVFWLFGFAGFYFYFLFAPISIWPRAIVLIGFTAALLYRACIICFDIKEAFQRNEKLFDQMYCEEETSFTFTRTAVGLLERTRRDRNPFTSLHAYAAMFIAPFVLVLNRILTPVFGDGHGVFIVLAFLTAPLLLWGIGVVVQIVVTMIYYPIKLQRETRKPVLMKNW